MAAAAALRSSSPVIPKRHALFLRVAAGKRDFLRDGHSLFYCDGPERERESTALATSRSQKEQRCL
jgi:hypothetical protein